MSIKVRCMDWTECLCGHARPWRRGQVARMKRSGGDFIVYKRVSLSKGPQASFLYGTGLGVGINAGFHGGKPAAALSPERIIFFTTDGRFCSRASGFSVAGGGTSGIKRHRCPAAGCKLDVEKTTPPCNFEELF